ncbi:MAG: UDP-N-acetylmuramoyl-tripeptide--D-alanyl-D-alanine ligase [Ardenticatenaceae bacterium]|nr:UDP-N-acetylmuramoyl-tripeptide--D-alanyl-D-alanine ligase [Ardenticatenaceae bacterium]MCB8947042.1 UDP-N-acetylmuramoyl-tripeptide--D-alanyl-D-alanine ligase [Ardenticatenaceae bacterium]
MLTLAHFLKTLATYETTGQEPVVSSVVMDSREVVPGSLFVAYKGEKVDGHDFVAAAFEQGAIAALVERPISDEYATIDLRTAEPPTAPFSASTPVCLLVEDTIAALQTSAKAWRARFPAEVIGITGSVGKTSTKELTHAVLSSKYRTFKSPGNRNSILGLPLALFDLQESDEKAVLEMGMYTTGEIATLCDLTQPKVGVVTLVGAVHLERAGSMENIVKAKRELVEALPADGTAILNKDDAHVMSMADHTQASIFTYGLSNTADLWADNIRSMGLNGVRFTLHYQDEAMIVQVPLLGRHSVHTSLRAAAVGLVEGLTWDEILHGLRNTAVQLRLVTVPGPRNSLIIDDTYNASPDSVVAALNLMHDLDGRSVAVLGDMLELGYLEEEAHRQVGRRAAEVAKLLVTVGQRARWIGEEAIASGLPKDKVVMVEDAVTAVPTLEELIEENDTVLVKGSLGMRMDQIITAIGRDS